MTFDSLSNTKNIKLQNLYRWFIETWLEVAVNDLPLLVKWQFFLMTKGKMTKGSEASRQNIRQILTRTVATLCQFEKN